METDVESLCCKEEERVTISAVCLHQEVLKATLGGLNNLRGDRMVTENRSMRYAAYRIFGKGVRKVIPCAVWIIRDTFPEESGIYVPFQEAKDELSSFL